MIRVWERLLEQWPDKLVTCLPQSGQVELFAFYVIFSNLSACVNLAFHADALLAPDSKSGIDWQANRTSA